MGNKKFLLNIFVILVSFLFLNATVLFADATEELGPPSISIAQGTGIVAAGTGLVVQPGTIEIEVPAGAAINQVLLYWEGFMATNVPGDDTITVNGNSVKL